jgi:hypothetical protein
VRSTTWSLTIENGARFSLRWAHAHGRLETRRTDRHRDSIRSGCSRGIETLLLLVALIGINVAVFNLLPSILTEADRTNIAGRSKEARSARRPASGF